MLVLLTALTSNSVPWTWNKKHQKAFNAVKNHITQKLLSYPNFNKLFDIHRDASDLQLCVVISQNGKPITFYSRKLNPEQMRHTTTEKELLAIVETLKQFKNILLGKKINVCAEDKHLTYKTHNSRRAMR